MFLFYKNQCIQFLRPIARIEGDDGMLGNLVCSGIRGVLSGMWGDVEFDIYW